jgi:hypothetical protein
MEKGSLVVLRQGGAFYTQPVGINDQVSAVRHHAGFGRINQHGLVLSDPDDWKKTPNLDWSTPWSQVLTEGRVVWVKSQWLTEVVRAFPPVV